MHNESVNRDLECGTPEVSAAASGGSARVQLAWAFGFTHDAGGMRMLRSW